ncbi:hypothetical protein [Bacillus sp. CGMCC 1.16541]|uniref:hypothetical protein n=1 Tax=Bacillus sp. CGMCC 1.16541 TaxID=2185143 RepID=UPI0013A5A089|nr:hypothetical protein [Bacillus sp. CGMCC 1.16541]
MKKLILLVIAAVCHSLVIRWVPINVSFRVTDLFLQMLMSPLKYIVVMFAFSLSFLCYSVFIRTAIEQMYMIKKQRPLSWSNVGLSLCMSASFFILFTFGFWQTLLILCFSFIYGIISIDLRKQAVDRQL